MTGCNGLSGKGREVATAVVHVENQVGRENLFHERIVNTFHLEGGDKTLNHAQRRVIFGDVVATTFTVSKEKAHHAGHSCDEVQGVFFPIPGGVHHAQGMDSNAQPVHRMAVLWQ